MIHLKNLDDVYSRKYVWIWLLSSFKAGFINSAGFLATGKFVSHVTGFGTQVGIAVGHDDLFFGAELLIIPISFIMGGVITSAVLERDVIKGNVPSYYLIQGLITLLILFVVILGESGLVNTLNPFDTDLNYNVIEFAMIGLLCLICGLKNALVTWTTFGKIRVTHLTGLSTDIGLHLVRSVFGTRSSSRFKEDRKVNFIRIGTLLCFSMGALISAMFFPMIGYKVFLIVMTISLFMTIYSIVEARSLKLEKQRNEMEGNALEA